MFTLKQQSCQNKPNDSYTEEKAIHGACGHSMSILDISKTPMHEFWYD